MALAAVITVEKEADEALADLARLGYDHLDPGYPDSCKFCYPQGCSEKNCPNYGLGQEVD